MAKTKVVKKNKATKLFVIQFKSDGAWWPSLNVDADGTFSTLAAAQKVAKAQEEESFVRLKYRAVAKK